MNNVCTHNSFIRRNSRCGIYKPERSLCRYDAGGGGHSAHLAERLNEQGRLVGIDRDADALTAARLRLASARCRIDLVQSNYLELPQVLWQLDISDVDGVMFDLGVSSYQLDTAERGFSYQHNGRLDMRMDQRDRVSAYEVVNTYTETRLADIIRKYGEEKWAKRISNYIVDARQDRAIETTSELVSIIKAAIPAGARRQGPHPAKRTFQALRIEVNGELQNLEKSIRQAIDVLHTGGRIAVISFHSLEDRIVKQVFRVGNRMYLSSDISGVHLLSQTDTQNGGQGEAGFAC